MFSDMPRPIVGGENSLYKNEYLGQLTSTTINVGFRPKAIMCMFNLVTGNVTTQSLLYDENVDPNTQKLWRSGTLIGDDPIGLSGECLIDSITDNGFTLSYAPSNYKDFQYVAIG